MQAYSMDLRTRVLAACDDGMGTGEAAEVFGVSPAWVRRLKQRRRETGEVAPRAQARRGPAPVLAPEADRLRELNRAEPDLTPAEVRDRLGLRVAPLTVWRALRRLGLTFKKSRPGRPSGTARTWPPGGPSGRPR
jgi:transposase